jgi:hypothetical protein
MLARPQLHEPAVTDPLRVYADLYHQAVEARRRVDDIRLLLARAAEALEKRPERFRFDGIDANGLPSWLTDPFAAAADWPSAEQIQRALAEWHTAADRLLDAWETLWPRSGNAGEVAARIGANPAIAWVYDAVVGRLGPSAGAERRLERYRAGGIVIPAQAGIQDHGNPF